MSKVIYLAGGCFWGLEKYLSLLPGALATEVGYANAPGAALGQDQDCVTYQAVCASSGHVEAVKLIYDPAIAPLRFYLQRLFEVIDPTSVNRQGGDVGVQYRSGVYWVDPADQLAVELELATLQRRHRQPIAVEAGPLRGFTPAEDYHQGYLDKNPGGYCHISPAALAAAAAAQAPAAGIDLPDAVPPDPAPQQPAAVPGAPSGQSGAGGAADANAGAAPDWGDRPAAGGAGGGGQAASSIETADANAGAAPDWGGRPVAGGGGQAASSIETADANLPADPARLVALSPLQRAVTQDGATEPPFAGRYDQVFEAGIYVDVTSGQPLFASSAKYEAGCGWPAFARPIQAAAVRQLEDRSYGRLRTEVRSAGSGAHLGHVFADGPAELGGLRYCINSAALEFIPLAEMAARGYAAYLPLAQAPAAGAPPGGVDS